jgi:hypothetical protein
MEEQKWKLFKVSFVGLGFCWLGVTDLNTKPKNYSYLQLMSFVFLFWRFDFHRIKQGE